VLEQKWCSFIKDVCSKPSRIVLLLILANVCAKSEKCWPIGVLPHDPEKFYFVKNIILVKLRKKFQVPVPDQNKLS
jgi:hypothetical protein